MAEVKPPDYSFFKDLSNRWDSDMPYFWALVQKVSGALTIIIAVLNGVPAIRHIIPESVFTFLITAGSTITIVTQFTKKDPHATN